MTTSLLTRVAKSHTDYSVTIAATVLVTILGAAAYSIAGRIGSPQQLVEYTDARRVLSFALPLTALGYGVRLPVFIARHPAQHHHAVRIFREQTTFATALTLFALTIALINPEKSTQLLGISLPAILALAASIITTNCTAMQFAFLRGHQRFKPGALLSILANGIVPLISVVLLLRGLWPVLALTALLNVAIITLIGRRYPGIGLSMCIPRDWKMFRISVARVPGDAAFAALFLIPLYMVSRSAEPQSLAVYNYTFVLLGMITAAVSPVSIVLLPQLASSRLSGSRRLRQASALILASCALALGLIAWVIFRFGSSILIASLLGARYQSSAWVVEHVSAAAVGIAVFSLLRTPLDAWLQKPIAPSIAAISLVVLVILRTVSGPSLVDATNAVTIAFSVLGALTVSALAYVISKTP